MPFRALAQFGKARRRVTIAPVELYDLLLKMIKERGSVRRFLDKDVPDELVAGINLRLAGAVYGERGLRLYGPQDVAAAIQNALLAATALGLGGCWVGAFSEPHLASLLKCPDYVRPAAIIALGWPAEKPEELPRQALTEFVHKESFRVLAEKGLP